MTEACPELTARSNLIHYSLAYSCRGRCFMTNDPNRGCVMIRMNLEAIPESTPCPQISGLSRIEYFREMLRQQSSDMKTAYSAGRVDIDSCTEITWTTEWLWVAIGLVIGAILVALAIMFMKKYSGKFKRGANDDVGHLMENEEKQETVIRSHKKFDFYEEGD